MDDKLKWTNHISAVRTKMSRSYVRKIVKLFVKWLDLQPGKWWSYLYNGQTYSPENSKVINRIVRLTVRKIVNLFVEWLDLQSGK